MDPKTHWVKSAGKSEDSGKKAWVKSVGPEKNPPVKLVGFLFLYSFGLKVMYGY